MHPRQASMLHHCFVDMQEALGWCSVALHEISCGSHTDVVAVLPKMTQSCVGSYNCWQQAYKAKDYYYN